MMELQFAKIKESGPTYNYERPKRLRVSQDHKLMDPYDKRLDPLSSIFLLDVTQLIVG